MSNEPVSPDPELRAIEDALGSLAPAKGRLDRDRVMFRAGQASSPARTSGRGVWKAVAASCAIVALGEGALLAHRPAPAVIEKIVVVRELAAPSTIPPRATADVPSPAPRVAASDEVSFSLGRTEYERLAGQVLRYGLDGLPASPPSVWVDSEPWPAPSRQLLREQFRKALDSGDAS